MAEKHNSFELQLLPGIAVTITGLTAVSLQQVLAQVECEKLLIRLGRVTPQQLGISPDLSFDPDSASDIARVEALLIARHLGVRHVTAWKGVNNYDTGEALPITPDTICAAFASEEMSGIFCQGIYGRLLGAGTEIANA
jgi:hypothetical protein